MRATISTLILVALCHTYFLRANAQIPKGVTNYKLKQAGDMQKLFAQIQDMKLSPREIGELGKIGMAAAKPGATAMTFENKAPNYILTFAGTTINFESGKLTPYVFLKTNGTTLYDIDDNKIKGKNTLNNGAVTEVEMVFEGKEVTVTRKTKSATVVFQLEQI